MNLAGLSDRFIQTVTGHKVVDTLKHYDPEPAMEMGYKGAKSIMAVKKSNKAKIETVTFSTIIKKVLKIFFQRGNFSQYFNEKTLKNE